MMFRTKYDDHEVGAGWVDPGALGDSLKSGLRLLWGPRSNGGPGWLGPIAMTLVVLSCWNDMSVPDIFAWLMRCVLSILT